MHPEHKMSDLTRIIKANALKFIGAVTGQDPIKNAGKFIENEHIHYNPENVIPDYHFHNYGEISKEFLKELGIEIIVNDIDGNVMGYHGKEVAPEFQKLFHQHQLYFNMFIISNSSERRYRELGEMFPKIPVIKLYQKGDNTYLRELFAKGDKLMDFKDGYFTTVFSEMIARDDSNPPLGLTKGDELAKPNRALSYIVQTMNNLFSQSKIAWIGDRLSAEITTANQAGAVSIWVDEYKGERKEPWYIMFARNKEKEIAKKYGFLDKYGKVVSQNSNHS